MRVDLKKQSRWTIRLFMFFTAFLFLFLFTDSTQAETIQKITDDSLSLQAVSNAEQASGKINWQLNFTSPSQSLESVRLKISLPDGSAVSQLTSDVGKLTADAAGNFTIDKAALQTFQFTTASIKEIKLQVYLTIAGSEEEQFLDNKEVHVITADAPQTGTSETSTSEPAASESSTSQTTESSAESTATDSSSSSVQSIARVLDAAVIQGSPTIPIGAITTEGLFADPVSKHGWFGSGGTTMDTIADAGQNNGQPYSQISLSGSRNWTAIWSQPNYRLDFSKSFHGRAYVNFGTAKADGFAFVMQNDSGGVNAITTSTGNTDGQNLGVYGAAASGYLYPHPESTAIQHSVAVEFDLFSNSDTNGSSQYDANLLTSGSTSVPPHMAYTFPGDRDRTYQPEDGSSEWNNLLGLGKKARMIHNGLQYPNNVVGTNVQDGTWYEFRFDFDFDTKAFTYYLKNPVTQAQTPTVTIPWSDLSTELQLSSNNNLAYWGFTAANGEATGMTKFVFTQVPVDLHSNLKNDVQNQSGSSLVVDSEDTAKTTYLNRGDTAVFSSTYSVDAGEKAVNINKVESYLDPNTMQLTDASSIIAPQAKKSDGTITNGTATLDAATGKVTLTFSGLQLQPGQNIVFTFQAKTRTDINGDVEGNFHSVVTATEQGTATPLIQQSDPVYYWVRKIEHQTVLSWSGTTLDNSPQTLNLDAANIDSSKLSKTFYWKDLDNGENLRFKVMKDGVTVDILDDATTDGTDTFHEVPFNFPLGKNPAPGIYTFTIEAYDVYYHTGADDTTGPLLDSLTLKVVVTGELKFNVSTDILKWTKRTSGETKDIMKRDSGNDITLSVTDSRGLPEENANWHVSATAKAVDGKTAPFQLVWQKDAAAAPEPMTAGVNVLTKDEAAKNGYVYTKSWSNAAGVLIDSQNFLSVGNYSNRIEVTWQLYDTEEPE